MKISSPQPVLSLALGFGQSQGTDNRSCTIILIIDNIIIPITGEMLLVRTAYCHWFYSTTQHYIMLH